LAQQGVLAQSDHGLVPVPLADAIEAGWQWQQDRAAELSRQRRDEAGRLLRHLVGLVGNDPQEVVVGGFAAVNHAYARAVGHARSIVGAMPVCEYPRQSFESLDWATYKNEQQLVQSRTQVTGIHDRARLDQYRQREILSRGSPPDARLVTGDVALRISVVDGIRTCLPLDVDDQSLGIRVIHSTVFATIATSLVLGTGGMPFVRFGAPEVDETERAVLRLMTDGLTDEAIARRLEVSDRTVRRKVAQLMAQVGADSRFQFAIKAQRAGLLDA